MSDLLFTLVIAVLWLGVFALITVSYRRDRAELLDELDRLDAVQRATLLALAAHIDGRDVTINMGRCTCEKCLPMPLRTDEHE